MAGRAPRAPSLDEDVIEIVDTPPKPFMAPGNGSEVRVVDVGGVPVPMHMGATRRDQVAPVYSCPACGYTAADPESLQVGTALYTPLVCPPPMAHVRVPLLL